MSELYLTIETPPPLQLIVQPPAIIQSTLQVGQGPAGAPGGTILTVQSSQALSGHRVVRFNDLGLADYASCAVESNAYRVIGITTSAVAANTDVGIQTFADITEPSWNWIPDQPIYLGVDGVLTQTVPVQPASKFLMVIGFSITPTSMFVSPQPAIFIL